MPLACTVLQGKNKTIHFIHSFAPLLLALLALFLLLDFFFLLLNFLLLLQDVSAEQFVPTPVEVAMLLATVPPLVTAWTSEQLRSVLVRCAGVARCVVAALGILA